MNEAGSTQPAAYTWKFLGERYACIVFAYNIALKFWIAFLFHFYHLCLHNGIPASPRTRPSPAPRND